MKEINRETWTMIWQMDHCEGLQEARKEPANGSSCSTQDQHPLKPAASQFQNPSLWINLVYRKEKKGSSTCTFPARVKICHKGRILVLCIQQALKEVVRNKNNLQTLPTSARSKHLQGLQTHPLGMQRELCCSAKSWFLPMKAQARFPAEFHYRERGATPLESVNGFQTVVWCGRNGRLVFAHPCGRGLGKLLGEVLTLLKLVPKFPSTWSRPGISPIKFLDVREAAKYWILFSHPVCDPSRASIL